MSGFSGANVHQAHTARTVTSAHGVAATAHPLATQSALRILRAGGSAVDATIAAQAVISVVLPNAAGIGGDCLALVNHDSGVFAVNGVGRSPSQEPHTWTNDGGASVTVPGIVSGWKALHSQFGSLSLRECLRPAVDLAVHGHRPDQSVLHAREAQRDRLERFGARDWSLLTARHDRKWRQPELAGLLQDLSDDSSLEAHQRRVAGPIADAVAATGGTLSRADIEAQTCEVIPPHSIPWRETTLWMQPPPSQASLLGLATQWLGSHLDSGGTVTDHVLIELIEAVFKMRNSLGSGRVPRPRNLDIDLETARHRGGPRAYLHTAGVAVADKSGQVVSSLISVFDDFGSAVFVPELGIVLNNRAAGFTSGENAPRAKAFPVHTLSPIMLTGSDKSVIAIATPGADGQIQTLLQILWRLHIKGDSLSQAISAPRWRSQDGSVLIEETHPSIGALADAGHFIAMRNRGDDVFGSVVATTHDRSTRSAVADWRRTTTAGVVE